MDQKLCGVIHSTYWLDMPFFDEERGNPSSAWHLGSPKGQNYTWKISKNASRVRGVRSLEDRGAESSILSVFEQAFIHSVSQLHHQFKGGWMARWETEPKLDI